MIAAKLKRGDEVQVVSPATSLGYISEDHREIAKERLSGLGLRVSYSQHGHVLDRFASSPAKARLADLHAAFSDPDLKGILTTLGGHNGNQLLKRLDYDLIRDNPKVLCGYSDITALATAIYARTRLVTYSGPHFSTFAMWRGIDYTLDHFERCLMREGPYEVEPADHWSDDAWYADQEKRTLVPNPGYHVIREGETEGTLLGGHLLTFCLLFGTPFAPDLEGSILLLESDWATKPAALDRELQSLANQPSFRGVRGIIFGRFQKASGIDHETLSAIIGDKPELAGLPIVADASFGHTTPQFTFPIGGRGGLRAEDGAVRFVIESH